MNTPDQQPNTPGSKNVPGSQIKGLTKARSGRIHTNPPGLTSQGKRPKNSSFEDTLHGALQIIRGIANFVLEVTAIIILVAYVVAHGYATFTAVIGQGHENLPPEAATYPTQSASVRLDLDQSRKEGGHDWGRQSN